MSDHEFATGNDRWTLQAWIEHVREQRRDDREALRLQHAEYTRRLEELNHAHEQAVERNANFVSSDKFDAAIKAMGDKTDLNTTAIGELRQAIAVGPASIPGLQQTQAYQSGRREGIERQSEITWARVLGIAVVIAMVMGAATGLIARFA